MTSASEGIWEAPALEGDIWLPIPDHLSPKPGLTIRVPTEEITLDISDLIGPPEWSPHYWHKRWETRITFQAQYSDPRKLWVSGVV